MKYDEIYPRLDRPVPKPGGGYMAFCPSHPDGTQHGKRSLIVDNQDGEALIHCFAGCKFADIIEALGITPEQNDLSSNEGITYDYRDAGDRPLSLDEVAKVRALTQQRALDKALATWSERSYGELCQLRRCCFMALDTGEDYLEHPEIFNLMQYCDHILDCLAGSKEEQQKLLELHLRDELGLAGRWLK
jgi:hypothetical protein